MISPPFNFFSIERDARESRQPYLQAEDLPLDRTLPMGGIQCARPGGRDPVVGRGGHVRRRSQAPLGKEDPSRPSAPDSPGPSVPSGGDTQHALVLVDTGIGNKESEKFKDIYGVDNAGDPTRLEDALRSAGF